MGLSLITLKNILSKKYGDQERELLKTLLLFPQCFLPYFCLQMLSICTSLNITISKRLNDALVMEFVFNLVENIVGKGENPGYEHFLLFPLCFQKGLYIRVDKTEDCVSDRGTYSLIYIFLQDSVDPLWCTQNLTLYRTARIQISEKIHQSTAITSPVSMANSQHLQRCQKAAVHQVTVQ